MHNKFLGVANSRNALQVKTRAQQPQEWAMIQNKMGHAFREQATRVEDAKKDELVRQASLANQAAQDVYSHATFPSIHAAVGQFVSQIIIQALTTELIK